MAAADHDSRGRELVVRIFAFLWASWWGGNAWGRHRSGGAAVDFQELELVRAAAGFAPASGESFPGFVNSSWM